MASLTLGQKVLTVISKELLPIFEDVAEQVWENLRSQIRQAEERQHHVKVINGSILAAVPPY